MSQPRRVIITYSLSVEFEIPEDFPLTAEEIQKTADWKANDWRDGRHPFSTELMHDGAERAASYHISEAIFQHYCRRVEKTFPPDPVEGYASWKYVEGRNKLVARCEAKVRRMGIPEQQVPVHVGIYPSTVVCPGCGQETPTSWRECSCSPGVLLPGLELRQGESRVHRSARPDVYPPREC